MADVSAGGWLLVLLVLVVVAWAAFQAWSSGVARRWLEAWGLRGARSFAQPTQQVAPPEVHRQHPSGPAPRQPDAHHAPPPAEPHRSGKRRSRSH